MFEVPDEIWKLIKDYLLDWKKYHELKFKPILEKEINNKFKEIYKRWTIWPIPNNTNIIIRNEYLYSWDFIPRPNLSLTSITCEINNCGNNWWAGYGWKKIK
jgi:hypothetical protein